MAAVCGITMQLGWMMLIFSGELEVPDLAAFGISVALWALAATLVHFAQGPERQRSYAISILKSGLTWTLLWGLAGLIAGVAMDAPLFETAGVVMGPLAGAVFGCLLALRSRTDPGSLPELLVLGTIAGTLIGLTAVLQGFLDEGTAEGLWGIPTTFAVLGALGGIASFLTFAGPRRSVATTLQQPH